MRIIKKLFGLYDTKDLVSFGNYLISEKREHLLFTHPEKDMQDSFMERMKSVSDADLSNWKELK